MSLQEIERSHMTSGTSNGFDREIDENSKRMVLDILQNTQYTKPIESTVRELASNAVDSEKEKRIAIEILSGKAKVEDYFITREGDQYKDSVFDRDYYDLESLNKAKSSVELTYEEGKGSGYCDSFTVTDHGVGLGSKRLKGYFSVGYSSKRNTIDQLGAFGLGAKASLSTGAPYYTVKTVHNGKKYAFNCYAYNIESLVPRWDMEKGTENGKLDIQTYTGDPEKDKDRKPIWIYYEETSEKNSTSIITPTKRHHRSKYVHAVKNQLLYFKDVNFFYVDDGGFKREQPFQAKVLHNSEHLLISDTKQFNKPHIVVVKSKGSDFGVSYGTVDFQELEMETLRGSIGFKCPIRSVIRDPRTGEEEVVSEGVSVTPSRESVIWDEHTRAYIQEVIAGAQKEAEKIVQKELKETNIFPWFKKNSQIFSSYHSLHSRDSAFGVLSNIIDTSKLSIPFEGDPTIKYNVNPSKVLWPLKPRTLRKQNGSYNSKIGAYETKVERTEISAWNALNTAYMYLISPGSVASKAKDLFILEEKGYSEGDPVLFQLMTDEDIEKDVDKEIEDAQQLVLKEGKGGDRAQQLETNRDASIARLTAYRDKLLKAIEADKTASFINYDEIEVPKTFEERVETQEAKATLSPAEKRALQDRIVLYTQYEANESYGRYEYKMTKREPKLEELNEMPNKVVYGVQKNDDSLGFMALFHENANKRSDNSFFPEKNEVLKEEDYPYIARFSKRNLKHIKDNPKFEHIEDMVWTKDQKSYSIGDYFIPFFTAEIVHKRLHKLKFFRNFRDFNEELTEAFTKLENYVQRHYSQRITSSLENDTYFKAFKEEAEKVIEAHLSIRALDKESEDFVANKKKVIKSFLEDAPDSVETVKGVDEGILSVLEELETYAEPVQNLFNEITLLTNKNTQISDEVSRLLSGVIESESLNNYNLTENSIQQIQNLA